MKKEHIFMVLTFLIGVIVGYYLTTTVNTHESSTTNKELVPLVDGSMPAEEKMAERERHVLGATVLNLDPFVTLYVEQIDARVFVVRKDDRGDQYSNTVESSLLRTFFEPNLVSGARIVIDNLNMYVKDLPNRSLVEYPDRVSILATVFSGGLRGNSVTKLFYVDFISGAEEELFSFTTNGGNYRGVRNPTPFLITVLGNSDVILHCDDVSLENNQSSGFNITDCDKISLVKDYSHREKDIATGQFLYFNGEGSLMSPVVLSENISQMRIPPLRDSRDDDGNVSIFLNGEWIVIVDTGEDVL